MSWAPKAGMITESYRLPIQESVRDLLTDLLGRSCAVTKEARRLAPEAVAVVADYVDDHGAVAALAVADIGFADRVGAALALVPARVAEDLVRVGEVPDNLLENTQEVLNIVARLFNSTSDRHVRLRSVRRGPAELPPDVDAVLSGRGPRKDFALAVEGYGPGRLALLVT